MLILWDSENAISTAGLKTTVSGEDANYRAFIPVLASTCTVLCAPLEYTFTPQMQCDGDEMHRLEKMVIVSKISKIVGISETDLQFHLPLGCIACWW